MGSPLRSNSHRPAHRAAPSRAWLTRSPLIVTLLVVVFPIGLLLTWTASRWGRSTRWLATGFVVSGLIIVAVIAPSAGSSVNAVASGRGASPGSTASRSDDAAPLLIHSLAASGGTAEAVPTSAPTGTTSSTRLASNPAQVSAAAKALAPARQASPTRTSTGPSHTPTPSSSPTTKAGGPVSAALCGAPPNPFGYNLCGRGRPVTHPAQTACSYFRCDAGFGAGKGFMVECRDTTYSMSGDWRTACSAHQGVLRVVSSGP